MKNYTMCPVCVIFEIWISGDSKFMKLYSLKGEVLKSVHTKSGNIPGDIAVTRSGCLLYTDRGDSSINLVRGTQIETLITLRGWRPRSLCNTSTGDLLVIMNSDDFQQTKVVRYSGSTQKQSIQRDNRGKPLYSSSYAYKYISENRNLDICVADGDACEVVVVSAADRLRFRYTGPPSTSFSPAGITTDSQGKILTSDWYTNRIHIIDKEGHFLRFIHNCGLQHPWGLCVDSQENLRVAERKPGTLKVLQYYQLTHHVYLSNATNACIYFMSKLTVNFPHMQTDCILDQNLNKMTVYIFSVHKWTVYIFIYVNKLTVLNVW